MKPHEYLMAVDALMKKMRDASQNASFMKIGNQHRAEVVKTRARVNQMEKELDEVAKKHPSNQELQRKLNIFGEKIEDTIYPILAKVETAVGPYNSHQRV